MSKAEASRTDGETIRIVELRQEREATDYSITYKGRATVIAESERLKKCNALVYLQYTISPADSQPDMDTVVTLHNGVGTVSTYASYKKGEQQDPGQPSITWKILGVIPLVPAELLMDGGQNPNTRQAQASGAQQFRLVNFRQERKSDGPNLVEYSGNGAVQMVDKSEDVVLFVEVSRGKSSQAPLRQDVFLRAGVGTFEFQQTYAKRDLEPFARRIVGSLWAPDPGADVAWNLLGYVRADRVMLSQ